MGGGTAGSVVANRLSQMDNNRVLVLEAGGDPSPFTSIPSLNAPIFETQHRVPIFHTYQTTTRGDICLDTHGVD